RGIFLRDAAVVERLAHIDQVVFDKTGTLTAREAYEVKFHGDPLDEADQIKVRSLARNSTHPLSAVLYSTLKTPLEDAVLVEEIAGQGICGEVDGIPVRIGSADLTGGVPAIVGNGQAQVHVSI